jgi:hypothetical protein
MRKERVRTFVFLTVLALSNPAQAVEYILCVLCVKDFTLSSAVGVKKGYNGKDEYVYSPGQYLHETFDGRSIWKYSQVNEEDGLIVAALRQKKHSGDTQVVVIDRQTRELYKTVKQGDLRCTSFGKCEFSK